jgi:hypothetical protein
MNFGIIGRWRRNLSIEILLCSIVNEAVLKGACWSNFGRGGYVILGSLLDARFGDCQDRN